MSPYGQPPQSAYHSMAQAPPPHQQMTNQMSAMTQAPPPMQQMTNQMSAMNIGGYGKMPFQKWI